MRIANQKCGLGLTTCIHVYMRILYKKDGTTTKFSSFHPRKFSAIQYCYEYRYCCIVTAAMNIVTAAMNIVTAVVLMTGIPGEGRSSEERV